MRRSSVFAFVGMLLVADSASAAGPWVDRSITLPRHDWAFNFGLGVAHIPQTMGPGINFEGSVGVTRHFELGFRSGLRFGRAGQGGDADLYGRPFDTETYGEGSDLLANPEFHLRGAVVSGDVIEVALEGRVYTPMSDGLGVMFGVPLALHVGRVARLDTGVYIPVLFYDPNTETTVSFPFRLWLQPSDRFWFGPMAGVRFHNRNTSYTTVPVGVGLGYSGSRALDFKTQFLWNDASHGASESWGFGAGIEVRIE
ncbi:MAG TPA: hypothetical protein VJT73_02735 [Polyangiaceae bacterium]|nr:hypothetical protein [Polyangiaceae bacterium]